MKNENEPEEEERKILLYLLGVSVSYIVLVGGLLVFILLILDVHNQALAGSFSSYLTFTLALTATFLHRPFERFGIRKFFLFGSGAFLIISILLFLGYFSII